MSSSTLADLFQTPSEGDESVLNTNLLTQKADIILSRGVADKIGMKIPESAMLVRINYITFYALSIGETPLERVVEFGMRLLADTDAYEANAVFSKEECSQSDVIDKCDEHGKVIFDLTSMGYFTLDISKAEGETWKVVLAMTSDD